MAVISVKLYCDTDVRRFPLDVDEKNGAALESLKEKIRGVLPNLENKRFRVAWKDEEEELISLSSDADLKEAIRCAGDILRVSIDGVKMDDVADKPQEKIEQQQQSEESAAHGNVFCDGCQADMRGIRYKCLVCPDFDLCTMCVVAKPHDEHPMLRIAKPEDKSWKPAFSATQMMGMVPPPFHMARGPFGCHGRHWRRHCHGKCPRMENAQTEEPKTESTEPQEKPQEQQQQPMVFDADLMVDLSNTISTVLGAFGLPIDVSMEVGKNADAANKKVEKPAEAAAAEEKPSHSDPKIAAALNYMTAMGYSNDGGWLTRLLEEKQGDVSAVLDVLHPIKKN